MYVYMFTGNWKIHNEDHPVSDKDRCHCNTAITKGCKTNKLASKLTAHQKSSAFCSCSHLEKSLQEQRRSPRSFRLRKFSLLERVHRCINTWVFAAVMAIRASIPAKTASKDVYSSQLRSRFGKKVKNARMKPPFDIMILV